MTHLISCPFCGSSKIDPAGWASIDDHGPACDDCGASARNAEAWNRRSAPAPLDAGEPSVMREDARPRYTTGRMLQEIRHAKRTARQDAFIEAAEIAKKSAEGAITFMKERLGGYSTDFQRFSDGCNSVAENLTRKAFEAAE